MRIHYSATHRCKQTGRRYRVLGIRKWGKLYYLRDGFFDTQATRVAKRISGTRFAFQTVSNFLETIRAQAK